MAKTLKEKNQLECNKRARLKYIKKTYKTQNVKLRNEEYEAFTNYCKENGLSKNGVIREYIVSLTKK